MRWSGVGWVLALVGLAACGVAPDESDLTVFYEFAGRRCDAAGVERIQVDVTGTDVDDGQAHDVSCAAHGDGLTAYALSVGTYRIAVTGLGPDGEPRYHLEEAAVPVRSRDVNSVTLAAPGQGLGELTVRWPTGRCAPDATLLIQARDPDGRLFDAREVSCAQGEVSWAEVLPGPWIIGVTPQGATGLDGGAAYPVTVSTQQVAVLSLAAS